MATQTHSDLANILPAARRLTMRRRVVWTLGNLLLLVGVYLLLFVGGLYVQINYMREAARGDNDLELPRAVEGSMAQPDVSGLIQFGAVEAGPIAEVMSVFQPPALNNGQIASAPPARSAAAPASKIARITLPSIALDAKVVEVGWSSELLNGQEVAVWDVAEYAVGHHYGTANPGDGGNIVMAGHVGGYGQVFRDLYYVLPGDPVTIYSEGQQYRYVVTERHIVDEEGAPPEQRAANAQFIAPSDSEMVTLVTCWPATGPDKFKQRVIIRALPFEAPQTSATISAQSIR
ncbi:MAG: sortase [Oscillochloris sp.]|nr:sortase [Oscillochloris sp.]